DRQVHPLGPGRGNDVRRIAGEEQAAVLHRFDDEGTHRDDSLLEDWTLGERPAVGGGKPRPELLPDAVVRPVGGAIFGVALQIEALDLRRAGADQGEAALMVRVDQLRRRSRRLGEDTEPAEGINVVILGAARRWNGRAADAVEAVAACDEVAAQLPQ